jgi:hypothetical protein
VLRPSWCIHDLHFLRRLRALRLSVFLSSEKLYRRPTRSLLQGVLCDLLHVLESATPLFLGAALHRRPTRLQGVLCDLLHALESATPFFLRATLHRRPTRSLLQGVLATCFMRSRVRLHSSEKRLVRNSGTLRVF